MTETSLSSNGLGTTETTSATQASGDNRKKYLNPPVVEAVARFNFAQPMTFQATTAGSLFEKLRAKYPVEPEVRQQIGQVNPSNGSLEGNKIDSIPMLVPTTHYFFFEESRQRFLGIGADYISAHSLIPYEGWEGLEARLLEAHSLIKDLIPNGDKVSQCSVRYINRVEVETEYFEFKKYLNISVGLPDEFPKEFGSYFNRMELIYPDELSKLIFTWASVESREGTITFILDFDISTLNPDNVDIETAKQQMKQLKILETNAFESVITDELRSQFCEIHD